MTDLDELTNSWNGNFKQKLNPKWKKMKSLVGIDLNKMFRQFSSRANIVSNCKIDLIRLFV